MHVCMYVCACVCIDKHVHVYIHMCIHTYVYMTEISICLSIYLYIYIHIYVCNLVAASKKEQRTTGIQGRKHRNVVARTKLLVPELSFGISGPKLPHKETKELAAE